MVSGYTLYAMQDIANESPEEPLRKVSVEEFVKHNKPDDAWVCIKGQVYDMTDFIPQHPGGRAPIIKNAGYDATSIFEPIHPKGVIERFLPPEKHIGELDGEAPVLPVDLGPDEDHRLDCLANLPPLSSVQNIQDFEYLAKNILTPSAWAYYSCGADDELSMRENHYAYQRIFFRPRVLVDVSEIDTSTELLGTKTEVPFYVSAAALAKLGNPGGECSIARGAGKEGVIQMISTLSSDSLEDIAANRQPGATQWFQLYVNEDRKVMADMIKKAETLGMKAIFVTVDAPTLGNREKDKRVKFDDSADVLGDDVERSSGASQALSSFIDCRLVWDDIDHIRSLTKLPVLIKGIQRVEDIVAAADHGCQGVVISNHGGRQLDGAPPPVEVLAEAVPLLNNMEKLKPGFEIFIDGGVRRGTDMLKALALGDGKVRIGIGMGRPFLYANSDYGEAGVRRAIQLLKDELIMDMRLLGVRNIGELNRRFVDTRRLYAGKEAEDYMYHHNYQPLELVKFRNE